MEQSIPSDFFKASWVHHMALDQSNHRRGVETSDEHAQKAAIMQTVGHIVNDLESRQSRTGRWSRTQSQKSWRASVLQASTGDSASAVEGRFSLRLKSHQNSSPHSFQRSAPNEVQPSVAAGRLFFTTSTSTLLSFYSKHSTTHHDEDDSGTQWRKEVEP